MAPVLKFNRVAIEERIEALAAYLGIDGGFDGFYDYVVKLNASLGIPANLTELGVTDPDMDWLVASALKDPSVGGNPVEMTEANTRELFEACM
jgi:alcohol dehydrogenase class IV